MRLHFKNTHKLQQKPSIRIYSKAVEEFWNNSTRETWENQDTSNSSYGLQPIFRETKSEVIKKRKPRKNCWFSAETINLIEHLRIKAERPPEHNYIQLSLNPDKKKNPKG